jgi:hypothetical protein
MKILFGTLLSECINAMGGRADDRCRNKRRRNDSLRRLNDTRLKDLSHGWVAARPNPDQGKMLSHWTTGEAKYEAPLPVVSSDSWNRFEEFLNSIK